MHLSLEKSPIITIPARVDADVCIALQSLGVKPDLCYRPRTLRCDMHRFVKWWWDLYSKEHR